MIDCKKCVRYYELCPDFVCSKQDMKRDTDCNYFEEEKPNGYWGKWIISEVRCPECLEYFDPEGFSKEELDKCPNCGALMRKEKTQNPCDTCKNVGDCEPCERMREGEAE